MDEGLKSKRSFRLFAVAFLVVVIPLVFSLWELYYSNDYFYFCALGYSLDSSLNQLDPNWAFAPYYANSLAFASGLTGAMVWKTCTKFGFGMKTVSVAFITIMATA